jgi:DNA polymerase III alpha subunit
MSTSETYTFDCGCSFPVIGPPPSPGALPLLDVDENHLPACKAVFELLSRGDTKGVFQLESSLGRQWSKRLKPESEEHLCALGALLRPGSLLTKDEGGKSMTERYCMRKNGEDSVVAYHPAVEPILSATYQVIAYQEQLMRIGRELAGFDKVAVDKLRKAVGKKDQQELAKVEKLFIDGCKQKGVVSDEVAATLWGYMKKSGRYLFNKSHAMSYGLTGYDTAYCKAHNPVAFYANWLLYAQLGADPRQEVAELVDDAKRFDVPVEPPDVRDLEPTVSTNGVVVRFGLADVKGVGPTMVDKLRAAALAGEAALGRRLPDWSFEDFLLNAAPAVTSPAMHAWCAVGAFRWTGKTRTRARNEYDAFSELTKLEAKWLTANRQPGEGLAAALSRLARPKKEGGGVANIKRVQAVRGLASLLENPPSSEADTPNLVADQEEKYLGAALTCSRVDSCDISMVNCSCKEFLAGRVGYTALGVEVKEVRVVKTKAGKNPGQPMAFLTLADGSCSLTDVTAFPDAWKKFKHLLVEQNTVMVEGSRDQKRGTLIVEHVYQL